MRPLGFTDIKPFMERISFRKEGYMAVYFKDGRMVYVPLSRFPTVELLSAIQRRRYHIAGGEFLMFQDDDAGSEAVKLKISAANGFEFFIPTHEATFFGFADRELKKDNQIMIERPTISGGLDRLFCSKLTLQFQPAVKHRSFGATRAQPFPAAPENPVELGVLGENGHAGDPVLCATVHMPASALGKPERVWWNETRNCDILLCDTYFEALPRPFPRRLGVDLHL